MNCRIVATDTFQRKFKDLLKKYRSLKDDLALFEKELKENPEMGDYLGNNIRKIRMAINSKNKGKRGGARIITYHFLVDTANTKIYLLTIYDKSEQESLSDNDIHQLKRENGLL